MRHVVSVGGGFSSTIELPLEVIRKHGAENVDLVICALAGESDDLWRLVRECERLTGKHVTRVSYAPDDDRKFAVDARFETWWGIWDVFFDQGMMGNPFADPCSRMLKRETMARYMTATYDPANTVLHVGITKNEIDRMLAIRRNWSRQGWTVEADLCDVELVGNSGERCQQMLGWQPSPICADIPITTAMDFASRRVKAKWRGCSTLTARIICTTKSMRRNFRSDSTPPPRSCVTNSASKVYVVFAP